MISCFPQKRDLLSRYLAIAAVVVFAAFSLVPNQAAAQKSNKKNQKEIPTQKEDEGKKMEKLVVGGGCFWCVEAVYLRVKGVSKVVSGYSGGKVPNPTYQQVTSGKTGHAEVVEVTYDPDEVSLEQLLVIFFKTHDPTTLNQQGYDIGTQYRSVVYYSDENQKKVTEEVIKRITEEKVYDSPIVTEVAPLDKFYVAEDYHQNYYKLNPSNPYCQNVVASKVRKFEKLFKEFSVNNPSNKK